MKENYLDKLAKDALRNYRAPHDPDAWAQFERQLDRRGPLLPRLRAIKSVEVLLLGLAFFTVLHLASPNLGSSATEGAAPAALPAQPVATATGPTETPGAPHIVPVTQPAKPALETLAPSAAQPSRGAIAARSLAAETAPEVSTAPSGATAAFPIAPLAVAEPVDGQPPVTPVAEVEPAVGDPAQSMAIEMNALEAENFHSVAVTPLGEEAMELADAADQETDTHGEEGDVPLVGPFYEVGAEPQHPSTAIPSVRNEVPTKPRRKNAPAGLLGGVSFAPEVNFRGPSAHASIGFTAQADLAYGFTEHLFIETGFRVSMKRFYEQSLYEPTGPNGEPLAMDLLETRSSSSYHFSAPVTLRYLFKQKRGSVFYVSGGFGANVVGWNFVGVERYAQVAQQNGTVAMAYDNAGYEAREEPGAFQQATSGVRNVYATAHLACGVQIRAAHNASIFIEPRYQQALTPIGREPVRVGTLGLALGARFQMR